MAQPPTRAVDLHESYERMVESAWTLQELYDVMEGWSELVVKENPLLECQPGCARCCMHQVMVGEREWEIIHTWMRSNLTKQQRQQVVRRVREQIAQRGNPLQRWLAMRSKHPRAFVRAVGQGFRTEATHCPFLDDQNRCDVYPVRPFVCRAYGRAMLSDGTPMFCEVFSGRYRQQSAGAKGLRLEQMRVMSGKYFALNDSRPGRASLFTITSAHILRHATSDDDIAKRLIPLTTEQQYPVVTQEHFPSSHT